MGQIILIIIVFWLFKDIIFGILGWLLERVFDLIELACDAKDSIDRFNRRRRTKHYAKMQHKKRQYELSEIEKAYENKAYKQAVSQFRAMQKEGFYGASEKEKYYGIAAKSFAEFACTPAEWEEARTWAMISQANSQDNNGEALNSVLLLGGDVFAKQDAAIDLAQEHLNVGDVETAISLLKEKVDEGNANAIIGLAEVMLNTMKDEDDIKTAKSMIEKARVFADKETIERFDKKYNESWVVHYYEHFSKYEEFFEKAKKTEGEAFFDFLDKALAELDEAAQYRKDADFYASLVEVYFLSADLYIGSKSYKVSIFEKHLECYKKACIWGKKAMELGNEGIKSKLKMIEERIPLCTTALDHLKAYHDLSARAENVTDLKENIKLLAEAVSNLKKVTRYTLSDKICEVIMRTYLVLADFQEQAREKGDNSFERYAEFYKSAYAWGKKAAELGSEAAKEKLPNIENRVESIILTEEYTKKIREKSEDNE